jgi:hypothetical protein
MSYKTSLLKMAIKLTPNIMVIWVANIVLKGIAELTEFSFDIKARKIYVQTKLYGEVDTIEVWMDGFGILGDENAYQFIIQHAESNKLWLNNILAHFVGKAWKIPALPQYAAHINLVAELFKIEITEQKDKP